MFREFEIGVRILLDCIFTQNVQQEPYTARRGEMLYCYRERKSNTLKEERMNMSKTERKRKRTDVEVKGSNLWPLSRLKVKLIKAL